MYPTSGATIRADLNIKVEEASAAERFYIARFVMPPLSVDAKSGTYPKLQIADAELAKAQSTIRERGGSYGRVSRKWTTDNYDCVDRGLEEPVDDGLPLDRLIQLCLGDLRHDGPLGGDVGHHCGRATQVAIVGGPGHT